MDWEGMGWAAGRRRRGVGKPKKEEEYEGQKKGESEKPLIWES